MKVYAQFFGGSNYACPYPDQFETFGSLREVKETLWRRVDFDPSFPCLENPEFLVFVGEPTGDTYPDYRVFVGPRGGIRQERC